MNYLNISIITHLIAGAIDKCII